MSEHAEDFGVVGLAAGSQLDLLIEQALRFRVPVIGLTTPPNGGETEVRARLAEAAAQAGVDDPVEVIHLGATAAEVVAGLGADMVLNAITGAAGLGTTLAALAQGTDVALANKESLIIGGSIVLDAARATGARLIPVDSEHSAIAQALRAGTPSTLLVLLAVPAILSGTYAGVESVDPAAADAARGIGMTGQQVLWRVELPIALPLLISGLRAAVLQVVATATIAAYVGLGGLGRFLIDGLATQDYASTAGGAIQCMNLALGLDETTGLPMTGVSP